MRSHGTEYPITDSSSSDGTSSTPNTPPSPVATPDPYAIYVEPQIVDPASAPVTPKKTPRKNVTPPSRLGAIDEDTTVVSPDPAPRNTYRLFNGMNHTKLFQLAFPLHSSKRPPPPKIYDDIEGPKGEKFRDVRNNTKDGQAAHAGRKRKIICVALVVLVVIVIVVVVLLAVLLTRKKSNNNNNSNSSNGSGSTSNTTQVFPAGTYSIPSYLTQTSTACTSNSATWRCYPYQTYNDSTTASFSVLTWLITSNTSNPDATNAGYSITSTDSLFSYPFMSQPLKLVNKGTANEAYTFTYPFTKTVFPSVALTSDGATTRCYFNNTMLDVHLYTRKPMETGLQNMTIQGSGVSQLWPYALDFQESSDAGSNVPNCYRYNNGVDGARVDVSTLSQNSGMCSCNYQNYGV